MSQNENNEKNNNAPKVIVNKIFLKNDKSKNVE